MSETLSHTPVSEPVLAPGAFELSVPRNVQGERIGTGAIAEPLRPGLPGERLRGSILKAILRAGRTLQAPRSVVDEADKQSGFGYITDEERALAAARRQETQTPALAETDREQSEQKLAAARSALQDEAAAQEQPARPQTQKRNEGAKQLTTSKEQNERETEPVEFYSTMDGHLLFTLPLPKGGKYTTADINKALKAAGHDFTYTPAWTPDGWRMRGSDLWAAFKKFFQLAAPPEVTKN